jgi:hypothetical protein
MTIDLFFYRTTNSSIHAGIAHSRIASLPSTAAPRSITSRACYKTPQASDIPARLSDSFVFTLYFQLCTLYWFGNTFPHLPPPPTHPRQQTSVFVAVFYPIFLSLLGTQHFVLSTVLSPCATILPQLLPRHPSPQQLRLFVAENHPFSPFCRSCQVFHCTMDTSLQYNHLLLQQPAVFTVLYLPLLGTFNSELPSANLMARLAALRHKNTFSAKKSALPSRVVAVASHFCHAAAAAATKKRILSRFAFVFIFCLYSVLGTQHSVLLTSPVPALPAAPPPDSVPALSPSPSDPSMDQSAWQHPAAPGLAPRSTAVPSRTSPLLTTTRRS